MENTVILSHFRTTAAFLLKLKYTGVLFARSNYGVLASLYVTFALQPRTGDRYARKIPASERNYVIGEKRSYLRCSYRE